MLVGRARLFKPLKKNALGPILTTEVGMVRFERAEHPIRKTNGIKTKS
jgi:hypothetical protein